MVIINHLTFYLEEIMNSIILEELYIGSVSYAEHHIFEFPLSFHLMYTYGHVNPSISKISDVSFHSVINNNFKIIDASQHWLLNSSQ